MPKNLALGDDDANGLAYLYPRQELDGTDDLIGCGVIGASAQTGSTLFLLLMPILVLMFRRFHSKRGIRFS